MSDLLEPKPALQEYLQGARDALLWKLDGLGERELRRPRTPTGTNLLGIVKHCANTEIGYFGPTFGRAWPAPDHPAYVAEDAYDADPQADWWVDAETSAEEVAAFYREVWAFADETIAALPLEARGEVPWWGEGGTVTLQRVLVHVIADLTRHAGHADILREQADGATGLLVANSNLPDGLDWPAYVARLEAVATRFPPG
ncbi:MAG: Protein of unknown function DUF664 [uncultured Nocardioides sp.]|uniref:Type I restriction-modification system methyltransferase subunit n=1 Tax=uncultured Nocardioides sp. TaxID=198441 RepID=A0A6J4NV01_9ACTN|nr:MAG: Protein of unknown function DUF664 [uncultured Nocardioides sp.]